VSAYLLIYLYKHHTKWLSHQLLRYLTQKLKNICSQCLCYEYYYYETKAVTDRVHSHQHCTSDTMDQDAPQSAAGADTMECF